MSVSGGKNATVATMLAGVPAVNKTLYHRIRFSVGDPAVWIELKSDGCRESTLILRDIEMQRARQHARADHIACPAMYAPENGLSGDRETATAQAAAEFLRRAGVRSVIGDRTLPLIYGDHLRQAGIELEYDPQLGVADRRSKDEQEIAWLAEAQAATEAAMRMACEMVARAKAESGGVLLHEGAPLTSERVRAAIDQWLMQRGYENPETIVACGPQGADCHDRGSGELRTGEPVIIDIFPTNRRTQYNGDCTRTVVHGEASEELVAMHAAVVAAKQAATAATRAGATGQEVHEAALREIRAAGYAVVLPHESDPPSYCAMVHGTGHGIGLETHEPPLLDFGGPPLVVGDALTIEPGLYRRDLGGVRVEDMVIVTETGCRNLNQLPEGLFWA